MTQVKMPEPVAYHHQCRKKPELEELSFAKYRPDLKAKGFQTSGLITTDQAEAYKDACVKAALESAEKAAKAISDKYGYGHYGSEVDAVDEVRAAIAALILKEPE